MIEYQGIFKTEKNYSFQKKKSYFFLLTQIREDALKMRKNPIEIIPKISFLFTKLNI